MISLEPTGPGGGYEFVDKITGGRIPREFIPAVDQGIQQALDAGVLGRLPTVDVRATLVDGSYHDVDSSEMAFKIAGSMAFKEAARKAAPVLLEPIMGVEVVTPEEYMGDVIGDLSSRRGRIEGMEARGNSQVIRAQIPLSEMFGYSTDLRSRTPGRAAYTMQFNSYQPVPQTIADEIVKPTCGASSSSRRQRSPLTTENQKSRESHEQGEVRAYEAACEHRDDGSHRSWEDDVDGGDHEDVGGAEPECAVHAVRSD